MNFIELIFAPFTFIIKQLFLLSYSVTNNYGLSIVLLSFSISLLLLPIFILIEKAKKRDDAVKRKMKPALDEIKRCYKGQERYYYIRTLNKQHNYSPIRSLIPILSLLLQIPFFIAAYQFLENFKPLIGVSFVFINDLSNPDALFGAINILPIAMTLVNLLTAYFYTRNGDASERKQMLVVALLFLILLFKLPSGLVLYWTMNNVFSFFRLFVTNREVFKKQHHARTEVKFSFINFKSRFVKLLPNLQLTFFALVIVSILIKINSALNHNFDGFFLEIIIAIGISFCITLAIALVTIIHNLETLPRINQTKEFFKAIWPTFKPLFFTLLIITVGSQLNWALTYSFNGITQRLFLAFVLSTVITAVISFIVMIYQGHLRLPADKYSLKISTLGNTYNMAFGIFLFLSISIQLFWAYNNHFTNIILKLSSIIAIGWFLIIASANIVRALKRYSITSLSEAINRISIKPKVFYSFIFLSLYFFTSGKFYFNGENTSLYIMGLIIVLFTQFYGWLHLTRMRKITRQFVFKTLMVVLTLLVLLQLLNLSLFLLNKDFVLFGKTFLLGISSLSNILLLGILFTLITLPFFISFPKTSNIIAKKTLIIVFILALFYVLSLVFFWSPLIVYSSFPEAFSFPSIEIFAKNISLFALVFAVGISIYLIIPQSLKFILTTISVLIALVYFINSFIIPVNVGTLQLGKYINASNLAMQPFIYLFEGLFLIAAYVVIQKLLDGKYIKHIVLFLSAATIILISQSLIESIKNGDFFEKSDNNINRPNSMSFSKDKENVVFFIADMFMGMHMKYILEESPELKSTFDGFVWYPNTLSVSTNTGPSISAVQGGFDFTIDKLNQDKSRTMTDKITEESELFCAKIKSKGYQLTSTRMVYSDIDKNTYDAYLPSWHSDWNQWNTELKIGGSKELDFNILWKNAIFYGLPLSLKPIIYKNGKWIAIEDETNKNTNLTQPSNFIRLMPYISDTLNTKGNFIYIHSEVTHGPWNIVTDDGNLMMDVSSYVNQKWFIHTFVKWINWMKENGVYDNTKIIIISDHSHYLPDNELNDFGGIYRWDKLGQEKISCKDFWRVNALLLIKDFNAKGSLKEDWRFMSNADAPSIAFNENDPTKYEPPISRTLPVFYVDHGPRITSKKNLKIDKQFQVTDSIYNPKNWYLIK